MDDKFLFASKDYLHRRHEIALRLLAECDKQVSTMDASQENELRDKALMALVKRDYQSAAELTQILATQHEQEQYLMQRRQQLRMECDRLCSARATLEERQELLNSAPATIEDPYIGGVGAYLEKRHETALRLMATIDAELQRSESGASDVNAMTLRVKRERLSIEIDTLLEALQVHAQREELLCNADDTLGDGAPGTSAYLRRVLAYLDQRSSIILKLTASIDKQLGSENGALDESSRARLDRQRADLVKELDQINDKITAQKRGEAELKACGLNNDVGDPYHIKVTTYLKNRSDVALQLIAFLDQRLESLEADDQEKTRLASQRDALRQKADETLAQIAEQEQGQALMDSLGVANKALA